MPPKPVKGKKNVPTPRQQYSESDLAQAMEDIRV